MLPALAAPVQVEAGSAAMMGGTLKTDASAGQIRGAPATATATAGSGYSGAATPHRPPPTVFMPAPASDVPGTGRGPHLTSSGIQGRGRSKPPEAAMPASASPLAGEGERCAAGTSSSSSSSSEPPLTPALQLEIAKELFFRLVMARENRMLSADEESLIKFIKGRVPGLEAAAGVCSGHQPPRRGLTPALQPGIVAKEVIFRLVMAQEKIMLSVDGRSLINFLKEKIPGLEAAKGVSGGHHSPRIGFLVKTPLWWAAPRCRLSSLREPPVTPALQLEMAKEVIGRLVTEQERRMLYERSLLERLKAMIPGLEAAWRVCGGATPSLSKVAPSCRAPNSVADKRRVVSSSSSSSCSSEPPLTPKLQLEIAKELISRFVVAQKMRTLSVNEHSFLNRLEDLIPGLEAASVVWGGATQSLSKVAPSHPAPSKASRAVAAISSPVATLHHPGLHAPLVHPPSHQVAMPAAHATVGQQVVTRHSGEEDAHAASGAHNKMADANVSHEQHRGQELSSDHESFSAKRNNSGCDPGIFTEKSSTTIAPEMAPPPSDGDNTAASGVSVRWGMQPDAEDFDDFGLPDDLGIY